MGFLRAIAARAAALVVFAVLSGSAHAQFNDHFYWVSEIDAGVTGLSTSAGVGTCVIVNGGLKCWGRNFSGEVGDGTLADRKAPYLTIASGVSAVTQSFTHSCAIVDGALQCWGGNTYGALGDGTTANRLRPVAVTVVRDTVEAVRAGTDFTCTLAGGALRCWGLNGYGQLGNGTTANSFSPVTVFERGVTSFSVGANGGCAVVDGAAKCWGGGGNGQLGVGTDVRQAPAPVTVIPSGVSAVVAGRFHHCALVGDAVQCFGFNAYGQIGDGTTTDRFTPYTVIAEGATAVYAADIQTCATVHGALLCWGLLDQNGAKQLQPVQVLDHADAVTLSSGGVVRVAVDGGLRCLASSYQYLCIPFGTLTFSMPASLQVGQSINLSGSSSVVSPYPLVFSSRTPQVCAVNGNTLQTLAAGTCTVAADQAGDDTVQPGRTATRSLNVLGLAQAISFDMPATLTIGVPQALSARASSGLPVSYSSTTPAVCGVTAGQVTAIASGTCTVLAMQAGDAAYGAADLVARSSWVDHLSQTVSFSMPLYMTVGQQLSLSATASSGLPTTFSGKTPDVCSVAGNMLTALAPGTCNVQAVQDGNAVYFFAAHTAGATVSLPAPKAQTISFSMPASLVIGVPQALTASASSGLPVSLASATPAVCTVAAGQVTAAGGGTCTVIASQAGDASYAAADAVSRSSTVAYLSQTVSFSMPLYITVGQQLSLSATASSGLPTTFSGKSPDTCSVIGNILTALAPGICNVQAVQAGDAVYGYAGHTASTTVTAPAPKAQTISFSMPASLVIGVPQTLTASASSGLPVSLASATPAMCSVSGVQVTAIIGGTCTVIATQAGDAVYAAAAPVSRTASVALLAQAISFNLPSTLTVGVAQTLSASASSGLAVSLRSTTPSQCAVSGNALTPLSAGTCTVVASQDGDARYGAAAPVARSASVTSPVQMQVGLIAKAVVPGEAATATVNVLGPATSGSITFLVDGSAVCSDVALVRNGATCKLRKYPAGEYTLTVVYKNGAVTATASTIFQVTFRS